MKDTIAKAASTKSMGRDAFPKRTNSKQGNGGSPHVDDGDWDSEANLQPLSNLYHFNIISSPSHDDEGGKAPPVVGEILDFDAPPMMEAPEDEAHGVSSPSSSSSDEDDASRKFDDDESVLPLDMFEGVFYSSHDTSDDDGIVPLDDSEIVQVVELDTTSDLPSEEGSIKRPAGEEEEDEEERSLKKPKTEGTKQAPNRPVPRTIEAKPAAPKPKVSAVISAFREEIVVNMAFPTPRHARRNRPNCLFVNHFGTRLNEKGAAEPVNVPSKNHARISSEESVSIKTKVTTSTKSSRTSSGGGTQRTPVKTLDEPSVTETPCIPLEVRIVTPQTNKPIRSSRLEDIRMEEDDLEPIHHEHDNDEIMVLDSCDLPYISSLTETASSSPPMSTDGGTPSPSSSPAAAPNTTSGTVAPQMMQNMMGGQGGMPVNFGRPFPLLQRRAFMAGSYPMAHPAQIFANGWPGAFVPHHCMPFAPHMGPFPGVPTSTTQSWPQNQS